MLPANPPISPPIRPPTKAPLGPRTKPNLAPVAAPAENPFNPPNVDAAVPNPACTLVCPLSFLPLNSNPARIEDITGTLRKFFNPPNIPGFIPVIGVLIGFNLPRFLKNPG